MEEDGGPGDSWMSASRRMSSQERSKGMKEMEPKYIYMAMGCARIGPGELCDHVEGRKGRKELRLIYEHDS